MRVLVIGGTELISRPLVKAPRTDGHWVIALNRVTRTTTCLAVAIG
jgi:uncharacterized protein YbjT (DUF2867 family)